MLTINMHQPVSVTHRDHDNFVATKIADDKGNTVTLFFRNEAAMVEFWQTAAKGELR